MSIPSLAYRLRKVGIINVIGWHYGRNFRGMVGGCFRWIPSHVILAIAKGGVCKFQFTPIDSGVGIAKESHTLSGRFQLSGKFSIGNGRLEVFVDGGEGLLAHEFGVVGLTFGVAFGRYD